MIIDALKDEYPLPALLEKLSLSKSSYYYEEVVSHQEDKYNSIRRKITELFHENKGRNGYRRIQGLSKRKGCILSEKVIQRIMREERLEVKTKKRKNTVPIRERFPHQCQMQCKGTFMPIDQTRKGLRTSPNLQFQQGKFIFHRS